MRSGGSWRARELVRAFSGGDPAMDASPRRMYENEDPQAASRGTTDAELIAYLRGALDALPRTA